MSAARSQRRAMVVIASVTDPDGRTVELSSDRWIHVVRRHPELRTHRDWVLNAVKSPRRQIPGRRPGQEWYYAEAMGLSRWIKVVVSYEQATGQILTAFPRRRLP